MDMDAVVALANLVLQAFASKGAFDIALSTGERLTGTIHAGWNNNSTLLGRTLDLTGLVPRYPLQKPPSRGLEGSGGQGGGDEGLKVEGGFTFGRLQGGFKEA